MITMFVYLFYGLIHRKMKIAKELFYDGESLNKGDKSCAIQSNSPSFEYVAKWPLWRRRKVDPTLTSSQSRFNTRRKRSCRVCQKGNSPFET